MIAATKGWSGSDSPDILPVVRRKLTKTLVRSARQAAFLTTLGLLFALSVAVGGFVASPHPGEVLAAVLPLSLIHI